MQEWFEEWFDSPYYHTLYKNRSDDEAKDFVNTIVSHFHLGNQNTLLDLACGKGRHSMAFASHGLDVTGVDLSKNSIDHALQFAHEKLHFYVHDMRRAFRANYFDMVCNLFTSFGYFKTSHDNILAAKSMYQSVKKDGTVLIDFVNRAHAVRNIDLKREEMLIVDEVKFVIERSYTAERFVKKIEIDDHGTKFHFEESLNSFTRDEMTALFSSVGFKPVAAFGNYQLDAYDEDASTRMILVFKK